MVSEKTEIYRSLGEVSRRAKELDREAEVSIYGSLGARLAVAAALWGIYRAEDALEKINPRQNEAGRYDIDVAVSGLVGWLEWRKIAQEITEAHAAAIEVDPHLVDRDEEGRLIVQRGEFVPTKFYHLPWGEHKILVEDQTIKVFDAATQLAIMLTHRRVRRKDFSTMVILATAVTVRGNLYSEEERAVVSDLVNERVKDGETWKYPVRHIYHSLVPVEIRKKINPGSQQEKRGPSNRKSDAPIYI